MIALLYLAIFIAGSWLSMWLGNAPVPFLQGVGILLTWLLVAFPGVGGLLAAYGHLAQGAKVASLLGRQEGGPYQFELGMANLALGVVGVMCLWMGAGFQTATAIIFSLFALGMAKGHFDQRRQGAEAAPGNSGIFLWLHDIIAPAAILVLLGIRAIFGS